MVEINGADHANEWVTVTFVLHAGSEAKSYRLELWSGKREGEKAAMADGTVIFDYSYTSISSDDAKSEFEQDIVDRYLAILPDEALQGIETTGLNIADIEKLVEKYKTQIDADKLKAIQDSYKAHYYTYSLYDSPAFQPFNQETASDGATGYDYNVADQTETLAYLQVKEGNEYTVFADYSATDKSISLNNPDDDTKDDEEEKTESTNDGSIWLLASSIILVIALVFAIIAIFLKDVIKKSRRNKVTSKNNYDQRKANRYKRKLHINNEEIVEVDNTANVDEDVPAEEATPVEEAETNDAVEEVPADEPENVETEDAPAEETNPVEEANESDGEKE